MSEVSDHETSLTPLRTFAIGAHELFTELTGVGFSEDNAVKIVIGVTTEKAGAGKFNGY